MSEYVAVAMEREGGGNVYTWKSENSSECTDVYTPVSLYIDRRGA